MITFISTDGELMVHAETELESYALSKWSDDNIKNSTNLLINVGYFIDNTMLLESKESEVLRK